MLFWQIIKTDSNNSSEDLLSSVSGGLRSATKGVGRNKERNGIKKEWVTKIFRCPGQMLRFSGFVFSLLNKYSLLNITIFIF